MQRLMQLQNQTSESQTQGDDMNEQSLIKKEIENLF